MTRQFTFFAFSLFFLINTPHAQITHQAKWQQTVNYKIDVKLDDVHHLLRGFERIEYINHSPHTITEIHMHLWPNAYKNDQTAFAKQMLENKETSFYFSTEAERGYIDSLNFMVNDQKTAWTFDSNHQDIAKITLNKALNPGDTCWISTPFLVKIPKVFSRLGHDGQTYNITQWYPKPAVFDANGWNPMPYLNQGEFYSEFGAFEVNVCLPKNYIIAATGQLQNQDEMLFRKDKGINTGIIENTYCKTPFKIVQFKQDNIHDFAWFASKNFGLLSSSMVINNQTIEAFVYSQKSQDLNYRHLEAIKIALNYYSTNSGIYPYSHASVVKSELKAGGGMEYPMITVCDILNPEVIIHEVGHNWFYGILGSNERLYPWMDESINSYFESKAMKPFKVDPQATKKQKIIANSISFGMEILAINAIRLNGAQAVGLPSQDYTDINYGLMVYGKGSLIFKHLYAYLGEITFQKCFRNYFDQWKFKHPLPGDIQQVFEETSGKKLDWFFKDLIEANKNLDVKLKSAKTDKNGFVTLEIQKNGYADMPIQIMAYSGKDSLFSIWTTDQISTFATSESSKKITHFLIDPHHLTLDVNRKNDHYSTKGILKHWHKTSFKFFTRPDVSPNRHLFFLPLIGYNIHNGFSAGALLHNWSFPIRKFEYAIAPVWSFRTQTLNGYANFNYKITPKQRFQTIDIGLNNASFAYIPFSETYTYYRTKANLNFLFKPKVMRSSNRHSLNLSYTHVASQWLKKASNLDENIIIKFPSLTKSIAYSYAKANYLYDHNSAINPYSISVSIEGGGYANAHSPYLKPGVQFNYFKTYHKKNKGLSIRLFAGTFISKDGFDNGLFMNRLGAKNGKYDYGFDESLIGRGAQTGLWSSQITSADEHLKLKGDLGNMSKGFLALNLRSTLPGKIPLRPYADFCLLQNSQLKTKQSEPQYLVYSGGIAVHIIPHIFTIYLPLFQSSAIVNAQNLQNIKSFEQRICFSLILNEFEPHRFFKKFRLF